MGDPLGTAVRGAVRVEVASSPSGRRRYQLCTLALTPIADGVEHPRIEVEVVVDTRHWPTVGQLLPARVAVSDPSVVEVNWDALAR